MWLLGIIGALGRILRPSRRTYSYKKNIKLTKNLSLLIGMRLRNSFLMRRLIGNQLVGKYPPYLSNVIPPT